MSDEKRFAAVSMSDHKVVQSMLSDPGPFTGICGDGCTSSAGLGRRLPAGAHSRVGGANQRVPRNLGSADCHWRRRGTARVATGAELGKAPPEPHAGSTAPSGGTRFGRFTRGVVEVTQRETVARRTVAAGAPQCRTFGGRTLTGASNA
jgi:hypothetical protein